MAGSPGIKTFSCPNCGGGVILRAPGQSLVVTCNACGSIIDAANENYKVISKFQISQKFKPVIPLGTRGKFFNDTWEVIGFVRRTTASGAYPWSEYLLFNPFKGFRWLVEADGHWNFAQMIADSPALGLYDRTADYKGVHYKFFQSATAQVQYVIGEFYWKVKVNEQAQVGDYVSAPWMLSYEVTHDEKIWTLCQYLTPEEVRLAFNHKEPMPLQTGVAPNQPNPNTAEYNAVKQLSWQFGIAFFLVHLFASRSIFSNLMFCYFLLFGATYICSIIHSNFETLRWNESSGSPSSQGDDDGEDES